MIKTINNNNKFYNQIIMKYKLFQTNLINNNYNKKMN